MQLVIMWVLTALAAALPWRMLRHNLLRIPRDFFLFMIYGQSFIYLHLAPTLFVQASDLEGGGRPDRSLMWLYALMQFASLVLFEWPFLRLYSRRMARVSVTAALKPYEGELNTAKSYVVSAFAILFSIAFLRVAIGNDIFHMPHYNQGIRELFANLPTYDYGVHRLFVYSGLFLSCILLLMLLHAKAGKEKLWSGCAFGLTAGTWLLYHLSNQRLTVTLGVAVLTGILLVRRSSEQRIWFPRWRLPGLNKSLPLILAVVAMIYTLVVANNVRYSYEAEGGLTWKQLDPLMPLQDYISGPHVSDAYETDPRWRLNGIDLMARITPGAIREGYAMGDAWKYSALISVGQWISRTSIEEYRMNWVSDPKVYLLWRYTNFDAIDWPNTMLNDLYGNWSFPGLLIGAVVLAAILARGTAVLAYRTSGLSTVLGIFLLTQIVIFEQAFSGWLFGLLRSVPVLLVLVVMNPFRPFAQETVQKRANFRHTVGTIDAQATLPRN
jgi:hypothetical protein